MQPILRQKSTTSTTTTTKENSKTNKVKFQLYEKTKSDF